MKCSSFTLAALALLPALHAADATSPIDYRERNEPFAPTAAATRPAGKSMPRAEQVETRRVNAPTVEKNPAAVADRRAALDVAEAAEKNVRDKSSHRPDAREHVTSGFNGRTADINPAAETKRPPTVAKYQDSLAAASASNMARFPALSGATGAKINRFVFRKNAPDRSAADTEGARALRTAPTTPAAGGASVRE